MKKALISLFILLVSGLAFSQESAVSWSCSAGKQGVISREAIATPAEDNYDVKYVKLNLSLTNASIYIQGDAITNAVALIPGFSSYVFELDSALVIDSILIDGSPRPFTNTIDVHTVSLATPLAAGTMFTAHVYYHGVPAGAVSIFGGVKGITNSVSPSWGTRITFTQSESYHAKEWWPCKQSLRDKIDSSDVWVTVPDSMKAGSNGVLKAITHIDATHDRYEWSSRHPIAYYLISVAVAPYIDYSYYMHFSGSSDSMLIKNFIYPNPMTLTRFKPVIDSIGIIVDYFSKIYSRYPFWDEKYGHSMAPLTGGMENQTMTTIGFFEGWVVSHELGHQWFGDNVTCGSWADIFCNEGFASYTEDLFREHFYSHEDMITDMLDKQDHVKSSDSGSIYVPDTLQEDRVFDGRLSYHKGACMLHMLRYLINNDSTFFQVYKTYQQEYKNTNGTIADFKSAAKSVLGWTVDGVSLDTFFDQWAYKEGFPKYTVSWNKSGNDIFVRLEQSTTVPASVACFKQPIDIRLHSAAGDTTIRVLNDAPDQMYHFTWSRNMNSVILDPNNWLLYSLISTTHDTHLSVPGFAAQQVTVFPNPSKTQWNVGALSGNNTLTLTDITGRVLWQSTAHAGNAIVPAEALAPGLYLLHITGEDGINVAYKLIKE